MYRPPQYAVDDRARLHRLIESGPFATIACQSGGGVAFAYAPVVLDPTRGPLGTLKFHLARANPLASVEGKRLSFSFRGPDAYISPDWYETSGLVPTWNYIAVETAGIAVRLGDDALRELLTELSAMQEEKLAPKKPWTIDKVPAERFAALARAIVGFSVGLDSLEGKFKLSQEKNEADAMGAISALEARGDQAAREIARAMREVRK